jgi:uncharacterized protein (TIGR00730 family)
MSKSPLQDKHFSYVDYINDPTWQVFKIMAEFVEGFSFLGTLRRTVTIFGSARIREGHPYYEAARNLGRLLAQRGFTVVTGGGPGIMEAANRGARENGSPSVGLNIQLPNEQRVNEYVSQSTSFEYFFSRKVMLDASAHAYIFMPGGFGTMDELFEVLTLKQTGKMAPPAPPVFLIGTKFWQPLISWLRGTMLEQLQTIAAGDLETWTLTDDLEMVCDQIEGHLEKKERAPDASTAIQPKPTHGSLWNEHVIV